MYSTMIKSLIGIVDFVSILETLNETLKDEMEF